jgi:hypothetical protein
MAEKLDKRLMIFRQNILRAFRKAPIGILEMNGLRVKKLNRNSFEIIYCFMA